MTAPKYIYKGDGITNSFLNYFHSRLYENYEKVQATLFIVLWRCYCEIVFSWIYPSIQNLKDAYQTKYKKKSCVSDLINGFEYRLPDRQCTKEKPACMTRVINVNNSREGCQDRKLWRSVLLCVSVCMVPTSLGIGREVYLWVSTILHTASTRKFTRPNYMTKFFSKIFRELLVTLMPSSTYTSFPLCDISLPMHKPRIGLLTISYVANN